MRELPVCSTSEFIAFNDKAIQADYTRSVIPEVYDDLDHDGTCVCSFWMVHEHIAGRKVKPHMRTMWLVPFKSSVDAPVTLLIDMSMDDFDSLKKVAA